MSTEELWEAQAGLRFTADGRPAFAANFESDDDTVLEIWPASGGATIEALCAIVPDALTLDAAPKLALDLQPGLVAGAIGLGLHRVYERHDAATPYDAVFAAMKKKAQGRRNSQIGSGPVQAKIYGVHF
jgi:hypothetical protein